MAIVTTKVASKTVPHGPHELVRRNTPQNTVLHECCEPLKNKIESRRPHKPTTLDYERQLESLSLMSTIKCSSR